MKKNMTIRDMWHYMVFQTKGYRVLQAGIILGALTAAALPYVNSIFYAGILDDLIRAGYRDAVMKVIWMTGTLLCLGLVSKGCERMVYHYCAPCEYEIRKRTAQKAFSMEYEMIDRTETLTAFRRVRAGESGMGGVKEQLLEIFRFFQELAGLLFAAGFVLVLFTAAGSPGKDTRLTALFLVPMLVLIGVVLYVSSYFSKKAGAFAVKTELENEAVNTLTTYLLTLFDKESDRKDIRLFGLRDYLYKKCEAVKYAGKIYTRQGCYSGKCQMIPAFASQMLAAVTYIYIVARALSGSITIGEVTMYAGAVIAMNAGLQRLLDIYQRIDYRNEYMNTYEAFITRPDMCYDGTLPIEKRDDNAYLLEFSHVTFHYPGTDQDILKDVSLTFRIGERLALVGCNGAGKTTLIKLLCRLYEPTEGEIWLNGIDIAKYDYDEYVRIFSVVFQDFRMYDLPLDENVASGTQIDEERLRSVLERTGLWERVQELPDRQGTLLGHENGQGVSLSGGESQKLAIARALYKDAPFIILDEPTAALDPLAEAEIYEHFDALVQGKTAVYISHRMSSCRFCDRIVVLGDGRICEEGTHAQLLALRGIYYQLYTAQAAYYKEGTGIGRADRAH